MADLGTVMTDERMRKLTKRLDNVYSDAYKKAVSNNEKAIARFAKFKETDFPNLTPAELKLKREYYIREVNRTKTAYKNIAAEISEAGKTASKIIQGEMSNIYGLNYDFGAFGIQRQAGLNLKFNVYDRNQLAVLVQDGQSPFTKIAYNNLGKDNVIVKRLQNQLIEATMNGESQQAIIRRIRGITGQSTRQAKRVAQTERTRVQNQGRNQAIDEANEMGVKTQKQWVSRMDSRVRDDHADVTGEIRDSGEAYSNGLMFPGDPSGAAYQIVNCRCYEKPMVVSVSPALQKHRESFSKSVSFDDWRANR